MPVFESPRAYSKFKGMENLGGSGECKKGQGEAERCTSKPHILFLTVNYGGVFLFDINKTHAPKESTNKLTESENTNTFYIANKEIGTVKVVEHFSGNQTYDDVIKAALRREFSD